MFYIMWQEWDMHWFDYYVVIAVCSDIYMFNDTFALTSTIVLIVVVLPFQPTLLFIVCDVITIVVLSY